MDYDDTAFDDLCDEVESYGKEKSMELGFSLTVRVFKKLSEKDKIVFSSFITLCITADGFLTIEEFYFAKPLLSVLLGLKDMDYEDTKSFLINSIKSKEGKNLKQQNTQDMKKLLSSVDNQLREDILMSGLLALACDGRICESERQWILSVFEDY